MLIIKASSPLFLDISSRMSLTIRPLCGAGMSLNCKYAECASFMANFISSTVFSLTVANTLFVLGLITFISPTSLKYFSFTLSHSPGNAVGNFICSRRANCSIKIV
eukprot:NODE_44_length_33449_cov_1.575742.p36 type:complete len:106 gc:universal NODE_44_length_33449_cov_1.575742:21183-21500(+)